MYDYIPKDEIWVEDLENKKDMYFNLQHEIYERSLMKANPKLSYNDAHDKAVKRETEERHKMDPNTQANLKRTLVQIFNPFFCHICNL